MLVPGFLLGILPMVPVYCLSVVALSRWAPVPMTQSARAAYLVRKLLGLAFGIAAYAVGCVAAVALAISFDDEYVLDMPRFWALVAATAMCSALALIVRPPLRARTRNGQVQMLCHPRFSATFGAARRRAPEHGVVPAHLRQRVHPYQTALAYTPAGQGPSPGGYTGFAHPPAGYAHASARPGPATAAPVSAPMVNAPGAQAGAGAATGPAPTVSARQPASAYAAAMARVAPPTGFSPTGQSVGAAAPAAWGHANAWSRPIVSPTTSAQPGPPAGCAVPVTHEHNGAWPASPPVQPHAAPPPRVDGAAPSAPSTPVGA
jgi:hypothetical protein